MPRIARKNLNTPFLHIMVQGVNKEYIFKEEVNIKKYLDIINKNKINYKFTIIAYCIMNNHAHFLVYTEDIKEFGQFMHIVNLKYAQFYNKQKNRVGVLFRNRYQAEPIYNERYLINCVKYIHDNPVKAGIVSKCSNYKYSSYKDFINNTGATQSRIMVDMFGKKFNYKELFESLYEKRFIDVEGEENEVEQYIQQGILEYEKIYASNLVDIISNRTEFKKLVKYLNNECRLKYTEISGFFEISKGTMDGLKADLN